MAESGKVDTYIMPKSGRPEQHKAKNINTTINRAITSQARRERAITMKWEGVELRIG